MDFPQGPFSTILIDPPWSFETYSGPAVPTQADDPYRVMSHADLVALPVKSIAAKNCSMIMWASGTHTDQALELGNAWGFKFVRSELFVWIKARENYRPNLGMGYWSRNGAEIAMLFKRGKPKPKSHDVEQVIFCPRGEHSAKPDLQYERIEALFDGPYVELFSRAHRQGWSSWGDQLGVRDDTLFEVES